MQRLIRKFLPRPKIVHLYPEVRFLDRLAEILLNAEDYVRRPESQAVQVGEKPRRISDPTKNISAPPPGLFA